jgi:hypothetical protein
MFEKIADILAAGLSLWASKEKTKYIDRLISLRKEYREEYNKPADLRSDAVLDNILFELCLLGDSFGARVRAENASN